MKEKWINIIIILVLVLGSSSVWAGSIVTAKCDACGYESGPLFIFGGRANFKTVCRFPAYCSHKKELILVNLLADEPESRNCPGQRPVPYTDPQLIQNPGSKIIASWNLPSPKHKQVMLNDGNYFCPNCKKFQLHFLPSGHWD